MSSKLIIDYDSIEWPSVDTAEDRFYVKVNGLYDIQILKTAEGIQVSIFSAEGELDPLAFASAFDIDALIEAEESRDEEPGDNMTDAEADADTLASAGWGTDEDYGRFDAEFEAEDNSLEGPLE